MRTGVAIFRAAPTEVAPVLYQKLSRLAASGLGRKSARLGAVAALGGGLGAIACASEPDLWAAHRGAIQTVLLLCQIVFMLQLAAAIAAAQAAGTLGGYLRSAEGAVDLIAAFAVPLAFALGARAPLAWLAGGAWALKFATASQAFPQLMRVLALEAQPLRGVAALFGMVLFGAAVMVLLIEGPGQPAQFGTLPAALWWAVTTVTTTGYGDAVPHTPAGRALAALVMISGLGVFGLFTGILATGFAAEGRRRDFLRAWDLIARVPFFRDLTGAGVAQLARALRRLDLPAGSVVFRRGRAGDCMYFIVSGEVEVDVRPAPVRLGEGSFFGEMALLGRGVRNATVSTTRPATLLVLDIADFRQFAASHPELAATVAAEAARRAAASRPAQGPRYQGPHETGPDHNDAPKRGDRQDAPRVGSETQTGSEAMETEL